MDTPVLRHDWFKIDEDASTHSTVCGKDVFYSPRSVVSDDS